MAAGGTSHADHTKTRSVIVFVSCCFVLLIVGGGRPGLRHARATRGNIHILVHVLDGEKKLPLTQLRAAHSHLDLFNVLLGGFALQENSISAAQDLKPDTRNEWTESRA